MTQPSTRYYGAREVIPDTTTEDAARALAEAIQAYWHGRGHLEVKTKVVRLEMARHLKSVYGVRSNLVGGLPPGAVR